MSSARPRANSRNVQTMTLLKTVVSIAVAAFWAGQVAHGAPTPQVLPGGGSGTMCGGFGWSGPSTCSEGYTCVWLNDYVSLCLPREGGP
ncbi:hypothetical protein CC1G_06010 [Coprinopsis cinerea okayama7|uniref:CBM1 domain-containing protein n=1 Tax=Coprinopsis cinerea (strain Okayama-7 / 130 / ATCC MYA-4618 / FGSC 9003) TaxID=240176 RepID=A8N4N2_COPC7|nr:hypothetical protein CC1G_06010 [Coprinopsis cinerea okayama7\|eukprot:XP_001829801.2 hypothetical protein CC1G_06010 [Coprinopsis cinerea okayama7\